MNTLIRSIVAPVALCALAAAAPEGPPRMSVAQLHERQLHAARSIVLYPKAAVSAWPRAGAALAQGLPVSLADLEPDYWRWPLALHLAKQGDPAAKAWFRTWLDREKGEWQRWPLGSLNHQLTRYGGLYAATLVLGVEDAKRHGSPCVAHADRIIRDVMTGQWWGGCEVWKEHKGPSAGNHAESFRSRHYLPRNWNTLWAIADHGNVPEAAIAAAELDRALENMRPGVMPTGLLDEGKLPRHRAEKDFTGFAENWKPFGLTAHPGASQVVVYLLFPAAPWRPELQGHNDRRRQMDERHESWNDYLLVAGSRWRPLLAPR